MEPSLESGQRLLINKAVYHLHEPERGDVIVFQHDGSKADYIKRIIGLPGEWVEIKMGTLYIHSGDKVIILDEPYIKEPLQGNFSGDTMSDEHYFVLGDNRSNSNDSRKGWLVEGEGIVGKAWLSLWPPNKWWLAPNHSFPE